MTARRQNLVPRQTQALSSDTFRPPPLDGSLSLPEIWDWHAMNSPDHPFFAYAHDGNGRNSTITWSVAVQAIHAGGNIIKDRLSVHSHKGEGSVIAILASSDTIPYATTAMAIMRANYAVFPISVRNSPAAVAHLLNKIPVKHMIVSGEQATVDLARDALEILQSQYPSSTAPETSPMLTYEELYLPQKSHSYSNLPYEFRGPDAWSVIIHSSGSTSFPKPIIWTNHRLLQLCIGPWYFNYDLCGKRFSIHRLPMFHSLAFVCAMWASSCGSTLASFEPQAPLNAITLDTVMHAAMQTHCDIILSVPSILELWARNPEYVKWLSTRSAVIFGGGPLDKGTSDYLVSQGVPICNGYGSTEAGLIADFLPFHLYPEPEYFRISGQVTARMLPMDDNTFELVIMANETNAPAVINTKLDGIDGYATSDLVAPHPTLPGYWKLLGRADDQIMHSTGEQTNPGPLESIVGQDPHVQAAVVFGRGRFQIGAIVEPKPEYAFDPSDDDRLAEFRNTIWPTIERMNAYAPQHSRLFKELILVAKPSKPFSYTAKGTVRRRPVIDDYEQEISALYAAVDDSSQTDVEHPNQWDIATATAFVRFVVEKVLKSPVQDHDDLFQYGCDSLQATWVRNTLLRALRESMKIDTRQVNSNFIYEYPTISQLAKFVCALASGTFDGERTQLNARVNAMRLMAAKYSRDFPRHRGGNEKIANDSDVVVLLTGTTGGFGCYILHELLFHRKVAKVYALNRAAKNNTTLLDRQRHALVDRGLDPAILNSKKVVLLEGDTAASCFGLHTDIYEDLRRSVTHIIHNAWRVDFNLALTSFETNVAGLRALVDFALTSPLASPPRLVYTSSVGVFQNIEPGEDLLESPVDPSKAVGAGYTESKWVSEQILYQAAAETALKPVVVRVGQLCGGINGCWNAQEWFPSMVQNAAKIGCFPDSDKNVAFIPLEIAASALADYMSAPEHISIVHLVHPRPTPWHTLALSIAQDFHIPLVPYTEWLEKLQRDAGIQLSPTFIIISEKLKVGELALGMADFDVSQAVVASSTLEDPELRQLGSDDVRKWLEYWRNVGLL